MRCSFRICEAILVTLSEHGMTLVPRNGEAIHVPGHPVKVRDVSGAGIRPRRRSLWRSRSADWGKPRCVVANAPSGRVGKKGTAVVTPAIAAKILPHAFLALRKKCCHGIAISIRIWPIAQAGLRSASQWLFRHSASRSRQGSDRGARRLRSADRRLTSDDR